MRASYTLDGKRVTKARLVEAIGADAVKDLRKRAWRELMDRQVCTEYLAGEHMVRVSFQVPRSGW